MDPDLYVRVRQKEGRLYSDEVVAQLPLVPFSHPLVNEWRLRAASVARLTRYLEARPKPCQILEVGCGNGWLSARLAKAGHNVVGLDINKVELAQAARVFEEQPNLGFFIADIFHAPVLPQTFDVIVLASVLQYFADGVDVLKCLFDILKPNGELHLIDTPLYRDDELRAAQIRTERYYAQLGFPELSRFYFHHRRAVFQTLEPTVMYEPEAWAYKLQRRLGASLSPFPWLVFRPQT